MGTVQHHCGDYVLIVQLPRKAVASDSLLPCMCDAPQTAKLTALRPSSSFVGELAQRLGDGVIISGWRRALMASQYGSFSA